MRLPLAPLFAFVLIAATLFAILHDLATVAGRMLMPWFWWMFP